jgi:integration host factor subunit alpha
MTKAEIVQSLYSRVGGFSKKEAASLVDLVFEVMKETLGRSENIKISGFGNFVLQDKRERPGLNPQTKERIMIVERRVMKFRVSPVLKDALRRGVGRNTSSMTAPSGASGVATSGYAPARTSGVAPAMGVTVPVAFPKSQ